jgi:hypothetical protein
MTNIQAKFASMNDLKAAAKKRYPTPTNGNSFDKEDFELRKIMAEREQRAYVRGIEDYRSGKVKL